MSHTVAGIDVGAHSIKFVLLDVGFRQQRVSTYFEELVPAGDSPLVERQAEAVQAGMARLPSETSVYVALPGEMLAVRAIELPFSDPRKIEQVVGYELEGQIVHSLSDVVFDYTILKSGPAGGASVLAAAARIDQVTQTLATMGVWGLEPRGLFVAPVIYQTLFVEPAPAAEPSCRLLVDVGHKRTNLSLLVGGETVVARTLTRGGEALTALVAEAFQCSFAEAERAKAERGGIATARRPAAGATAQRMDAVLREGLVPLVREIRQTLASFAARDRRPVDAIMLTGGGAELPGLGEFLAEELEIPVSLFSPDLAGQSADPVTMAGENRFTLAAAIAWAGARGRKEIDLRRGPFQYRASYSILRQRGLHLAALAAALIVSISIDGSMALDRLTKESDELQTQLKTATTELFGAPRMDARAVALELKRGFRDEMVPLPKATAFDLVNEISRKMPSSERIKLDVMEIDIKPKKTMIKGTVDSAAAVDEMVSKLKEIDCFEEITKGAITEASGGGKTFTLNIASKCP